MKQWTIIFVFMKSKVDFPKLLYCYKKTNWIFINRNSNSRKEILTYWGFYFCLNTKTLPSHISVCTCSMCSTPFRNIISDKRFIDNSIKKVYRVAFYQNKKKWNVNYGLSYISLKLSPCPFMNHFSKWNVEFFLVLCVGCFSSYFGEICSFDFKTTQSAI